MKGIVFLALLGLPISSGSQTAEELWKGTCQVCHTEPSTGAPQLGDKAAWGPRIAKGKDVLYRSALGGFAGPKGTEMPARGGNPSLTDAQVKAAVDYMISKGEGK